MVLPSYYKLHFPSVDVPGTQAKRCTSRNALLMSGASQWTVHHVQEKAFHAHTWKQTPVRAVSFVIYGDARIIPYLMSGTADESENG